MGMRVPCRARESQANTTACVSSVSHFSLILASYHLVRFAAEIVPPAKFIHDEDGRRGFAVSSLVSGDCIISGSEVRRSLLFTGVKIGSFSNVQEAVILPYCNIGRGARLNRVIVDSGVRIPEGMVIGEDPEFDARRFRVTERGVVLVTRDMMARLV